MVTYESDILDKISITNEILSVLKTDLTEVWEVITEGGHNTKVKESTLKGVSKVNEQSIYYYHGYYFTPVSKEVVIIHNFTKEGGTNNPLQKAVDYLSGYNLYRYGKVGELDHVVRDRAYWFANHCRKVCYYELGGTNVYFHNGKATCYIESPATSVNWFNKDQFYWIGLYNDINYIKLEQELEDEENLKHLQYN